MRELTVEQLEVPGRGSTVNALTVPLGWPSYVLSSLTAYRNRRRSNARYDGLATPVVVASGRSAAGTIQRERTRPRPCPAAPCPCRTRSARYRSRHIPHRHAPRPAVAVQPDAADELARLQPRDRVADGTQRIGRAEYRRHLSVFDHAHDVDQILFRAAAAADDLELGLEQRHRRHVETSRRRTPRPGTCRRDAAARAPRARSRAYRCCRRRRRRPRRR